MDRKASRCFFTVALLATLFTLASQGSAQNKPSEPIKNIVLVHGAWADGSSYAKVIPLLEAKGFHVTAVQNPLSSFNDDVAAAKRIIDAQDGPVVLVGHSYGGSIITEAGNNPKVAALVYIAAFGPDTGESLATTGKGFAPTPASTEIRQIEDGYLVLTEKGVVDDFCQDLSPTERRVLLAVQGPTAASIFAAPIAHASWHEKPSWFVVAANDRTINPDYERFVAKRMGATVTTVQSSHVAMLAKPKEVADVISAAAVSDRSSAPAK
jgi:pimeloyl-ACP methyl ester carboxylesterase